MAVGSPVGARLAKRYGVGLVSGLGLLVVAAAFLANLTFDVDTPLAWFCTVGFISGVAMGLAIAPTVAAVIAVLPVDRMGAGSAVNNTVRQVGSVLGIALLGTILTTRVPGPDRARARRPAGLGPGRGDALGRAHPRGRRRPAPAGTHRRGEPRVRRARCTSPPPPPRSPWRPARRC